MDDASNTIRELLDSNNKGLIGFGSRQIKCSAEQAAKIYGCEWAKKFPATQEAFILKQNIRAMVMSNTPSNHSNKDVVWQRFRQYALKFCGQ